MTHTQRQQLANELGINENVAYMSQTRLVRNVQIRRGNEPCFSTEKRYNCEEDCEWSRSCRKLRAVWLR
ncbi:hypothetical protein FGKAn22_13960 [Ferrigenium kumadai]|uniref:Uncharacterized protein n=1 Tax=Ferrigenium kumadai TaxID=1682490 RepID=A0AAN1SZ06_9PROT|nr:hypothetical protein FGKAn22_13960 [Ferrigenium kumadai]